MPASTITRLVLIVSLTLVLLPTTASAKDKEDWEHVRLVADYKLVEGCEFVGEVKGGSPWGGVLKGAAENKAMRQIKRNANKLGANFVVYVSGSSGWSGSKYRGEAFICPVTPTPTVTPEPTITPEPTPPADGE